MGNLAGIGQRFIALVIDTVIVGIVGSVLYAILGNPGGFVGFLIGAAYQWYFMTRNKGQTPGKVLLGIRVVKEDGSALTEVDAVVRYVGYYVNTFLLLIGWIWAIFDDKHQGIHDKMAGTLVVKT